jgi:hypothetical protein
MKRAPLSVCLVLAMLGLIAWHYWPHRMPEFRGTLRYQFFMSIPEDPLTDAILLTSAGAYELDIGRNPQWRGCQRRFVGHSAGGSSCSAKGRSDGQRAKV